MFTGSKLRLASAWKIPGPTTVQHATLLWQSVFGRKNLRWTHACKRNAPPLHTRARAHTHTHTTHTHIRTQNTLEHTHAHTHTHKHMNTHIHTCAHTHTHTHTPAHTQSLLAESLPSLSSIASPLLLALSSVRSTAQEMHSAAYNRQGEQKGMCLWSATGVVCVCVCVCVHVCVSLMVHTQWHAS